MISGMDPLTDPDQIALAKELEKGLWAERPQWTYRVEYEPVGFGQIDIENRDLNWHWTVFHGGTLSGDGWAMTRDDGVAAATEFGNEERAKINEGCYDPVEGAL